MSSKIAPTFKTNTSSRPSLDQLHSPFQGKALVTSKTCRRSDKAAMTARPTKYRDNLSTTGGGWFDSDLLSPPISVESLDTPPFKPTDSDETSLSMKNRRRRRRRRHRDSLGRASWTGITGGRAIRRRYARNSLAATSVPELRHDPVSRRVPSAAGRWFMEQESQALHAAYRRDSIIRSIGCKRRATLPQMPRRWIMSSKAASTRVLVEPSTRVVTTIILPSKNQPQLSPRTAESLGMSRPRIIPPSQAETSSSSTEVRETPAMITLRRATQTGTSPMARKTSLRPNAIISFPAPRFNRTTSTYLSSFFGLGSSPVSTKDVNPIQTRVRQASWSTGQDVAFPMRKASVTVDRIQLTANTVAPPASTQVGFHPLHPYHGNNHQGLLTLPARRCSTTIISGSSVHEIIWDESITSSSEGSTSPEASGRNPKGDNEGDTADSGRRQSVVVEKLEAYLRNNEQRQMSPGSKVSCQRRTLAHGNEWRKALLQELAGWNLGSRYEADKPGQSSLIMDLRSQLNHNHPARDEEHLATFSDEGQLSPRTEQVEFFPPLEGAAANSQRPNPSPGQSARASAKRGLREEPTPGAMTAAPASLGLAQEGEGKPRKPASRPPRLRWATSSDSHLAMRNGLGQSPPMRRRSTHSHPHLHSNPPHHARGPWPHSHKESKRRASAHDEYDERRALLAQTHRPNDSASSSACWGGRYEPSLHSRDIEANKICVQEFVQKIESMSGDRVWGSVDRGADDHRTQALGVGEAPWSARTGVTGRERDKAPGGKQMGGGKGMGMGMDMGIRKVLSEVGEEGGSLEYR